MVLFVTLYSTAHLAAFNYTCWNNPLRQGQASYDYMFCGYYLVVIHPGQLLLAKFGLSNFQWHWSCPEFP